MDIDSKESLGTADTPIANLLATAAPGSIFLCGNKYLVAQPTEQDMGAIFVEAAKIAKRQRNAKLVELVKDFKDYELAKKVLDETMPVLADEAVQGIASINQALSDPEGVHWIAFILLRKLQPSITLADIKTLIPAENATAVGVELLFESGMGKAAPNSHGASGTPS